MRVVRSGAVLGVAMALLLGGAATAGGPDAARIVALGGSVTEIIYAIGAGDRLVAADATSRYPERAELLPKVGYLRTLSAEGILSLRPDLIVGLDDAGPLPVLKQLEAAGAAPRLIHEQYSLAGVTAKIRFVAAAIGANDRGTQVADVVAADLTQITAALGEQPHRPKVLFLLSAGRGAPLAAGENTAADAMIRLAGGRNAISGYHGYKPLSMESALAAEPDVLLMMQQTVDTLGGEAEILGMPQIAATPAGRAKRLIALDGLYLLGFGPRTAHAVRDLALKFYPDLQLPPLPARQWMAGVPAK